MIFTGDFIKEKHLIKHFPNRDDSCLLNIGYDDFSFVKPWDFFRVQKIYTLHIVISGKGYLEIKGRTHSIKKGQMFFIPSNEKMRYFPDKDEPWEYVWFTLKGDVAKAYGESIGFSLDTPCLECRQYSKVLMILKNMLEALLDDSGGYFTALSSFYNVLEICTSQKHTTGIQDIKEHIDETFATPEFNISQLCHDVGISHANLLRQFKKEYGITVVKYVIKKRLNLACTLLRTTDLSVKSVAYSCGFTDEVHFMKTFKKEMGVSAGNYRKS